MNKLRQISSWLGIDGLAALMSSEYGTCETSMAGSWPRLAGNGLQTLSRCSLSTLKVRRSERSTTCGLGFEVWTLLGLQGLVVGVRGVRFGGSLFGTETG